MLTVCGMYGNSTTLILLHWYHRYPGNDSYISAEKSVIVSGPKERFIVVQMYKKVGWNANAKQVISHVPPCLLNCHIKSNGILKGRNYKSVTSDC